MDTLDLEHLCCDGARAAEILLAKGFRVDVRKALDPLNDRDYLKIVARLSRALSRATADTEAPILNRALDNLDVDWPTLSSGQRRRIIEAVGESLFPIPRRVTPVVRQELTVTGTRVMEGTRRGARRRLSATLRTRIGTSLTAGDRRILDHMAKSQGLFVTDEYRRRRDDFGRQAKEIVSNGLERGLGRDEITDDLQRRFASVAGINRSRHYWNVIAATFANRSRVYSHLASMEEAGIERYVFEAVLDERTTEQCRFLHGMTFEVGAGLDRFRRVEEAEDPEQVKEIQPWLRVARDESGNKVLFWQDLAGNRTRVAEVVRSGVGTRDDTGTFRSAFSSRQLQDMGVSMPPLHGLCRSTVVSDV